MTVSDIEALPVSNGHDEICKLIFKAIYNTKFPDKPTECAVNLHVDFGTANLKLKKEIKLHEHRYFWQG